MVPQSKQQAPGNEANGFPLPHLENSIIALPYNGLASPLGLPRQGSHSSPDSEP
jgi:hypothetical protein